MTAAPRDDQALAAMTLDILGNVLGQADNPSRLVDYLTEEIRGLTGARCVAFIDFTHRVRPDEPTILIHPARRQEIARSSAIQQLCQVAQGLRAPHHWPAGDPADVARLLGAEGFENSAAVPLAIGQTTVAAMALLGLPDEPHIASELRMLNTLSTVIALVLRNAMFYEQQEQVIAQRTSELLAANRQLLESRERLDLALASARMGVWEWDIATDQFLCDATSDELIQVAPDGQPKPMTLFYQAIHPDDRPQVQAAIDRALEHNAPFEATLRVIWPDQSVHVLTSRGRVYRDSDAKPLRMAGLAWDITQQTHVEQRLAQSEKIEAIGRLAGGVAHDFNNQLAGILGYADMLAQRLGDETLRGYAESIVKAARTAADLTKQLLAFARKGKYESTPLDMHRLIREATDFLRHVLDRKIEIRTLLHAAPSIVAGDPSQLHSALVNLAINARDAMPDGGTLSFGTSVVDVTDMAAELEVPPGRYLRVCVSDTGTGMDPQTLQHIFEPFFTTKAQGKGTGLGLAAVYGAVKSHRGAIRVYSELGHGTTVSLYLPLPEQPGGEAPAAPAASSLRMGHGRILVVEDEEMIRKMLTAMLQRCGYEVELCKDGREAIDFYRDHWRRIDLVILDMVMPHMGGRETFAELRRINPAVKVVLSSGYSLDGQAQALLDQGVGGFVQKPYQAGELSELLARLLG